MSQEEIAGGNTPNAPCQIVELAERRAVRRRAPVLDSLRTLVGKLIVRLFTCPCGLVLAAWFCLAAEADDTEEKRRCLNAILELDPENEPATLALLVLDQKRPDS